MPRRPQRVRWWINKLLYQKHTVDDTSVMHLRGHLLDLPGIGQ